MGAHEVVEGAWSGCPRSESTSNQDAGFGRASSARRMRASAWSLQGESGGTREAQRTAAFELRGSAPVGIPQTQANRAQFVSMCVDEFARYPQCASQFTHRNARI